MLKIVTKNSRFDEIKRGLKSTAISAGIHRSAGKHKNADVPVATVAAWVEYGNSRTPERPAFRVSFSSNRRKYMAELAKIAQRELQGVNPTRSMVLLGEQASTDIQRSMASGNWIPNAPSTQLKKGRGKQEINRPWIDTGQTIDSVDWEWVNL